MCMQCWMVLSGRKIWTPARSISMSRSQPCPLIVVIENDSQLGDAIGLLLHDWGFSAVSAKSACAAARVLGSRIKNVSAVIVDYHLDDGFTGIQSAVALANAIGRPVPTI